MKSYYGKKEKWDIFNMKKFTVIMLFATGVIFFVVYPRYLYVNLATPPLSFNKLNMDDIKIISFEKNGVSYYCVRNTSIISDWRFRLVLSSFCPVYIYSKESGKLVDWSLDPGDDNTFYSKWGICFQDEINTYNN